MRRDRDRGLRERAGPQQWQPHVPCTSLRGNAQWIHFEVFERNKHLHVHGSSALRAFPLVAEESICRLHARMEEECHSSSNKWYKDLSNNALEKAPTCVPDVVRESQHPASAALLVAPSKSNNCSQKREREEVAAVPHEL